MLQYVFNSNVSLTLYLADVFDLSISLSLSLSLYIYIYINRPIRDYLVAAISSHYTRGYALGPHH